ncbi:MAG: hypothetical protein AABW67_03215 [Nanoarchaeota archaeon]
MAYVNTITDILNQWADYGVFAYVLPFLLIFAVVFGILSKTKVLGENKGVQATIALAIGLLALQFDYVSNFFATITPYFGIAIIILLTGVILMGLIYNGEKTKWLEKVFFGLGTLIFIILVITSISDSNLIGGYRFSQYWPAITAAIILLLLVSLIIWGDKMGSKTP